MHPAHGTKLPWKATGMETNPYGELLFACSSNTRSLLQYIAKSRLDAAGAAKASGLQC